MSWRGGFDGKVYTIPEFDKLVDALPDKLGWSPRGFVFHNTYIPDLARTKEIGLGKYVRNMAGNYRDKLGWSGGPHGFTGIVNGEAGVSLGSPLTGRGTHSPSFNRRWLGWEMCANYELGKDDDDFGEGFLVKDATCMVAAILLDKLDLDAGEDTIKLHKMDPRTTHDCPGADIEYEDLIDRVKAYMDDFNEAGDHGALARKTRLFPADGIVNTKDLNLRATSGLKGEILESLTKLTPIKVIGEAKNGATTWLRVTTPENVTGWVSARFVTPSCGPSIPKPSPRPGLGEKWMDPGNFKFTAFGVFWLGTIESLRLKVYRDGGSLAGGFGHNNASGRPPIWEYEGQPISHAVAEQAFRDDIAAQLEYLNKLVKVPLLPHHVDALLIHIFRSGPTEFRNGEVLPHINAREFWSAGRKIRFMPTSKPGIKRRHAVEADLWEGKRPDPRAW